MGMKCKQDMFLQVPPPPPAPPTTYTHHPTHQDHPHQPPHIITPHPLHTNPTPPSTHTTPLTRIIPTTPTNPPPPPPPTHTTPLTRTTPITPTPTHHHYLYTPLTRTTPITPTPTHDHHLHTPSHSPGPLNPPNTNPPAPIIHTIHQDHPTPSPTHQHHLHTTSHWARHPHHSPHQPTISTYIPTPHSPGQPHLPIKKTTFLVKSSHSKSVCDLENEIKVTKMYSAPKIIDCLYFDLDGPMPPEYCAPWILWPGG